MSDELASAKNVVNTISLLGIDMIENAASGHPGIVLSAAPMMYSLYAKNMNIFPKDPKWFNRDRFVLSAGHGSALLYSTLYLAGYDIKIEDLKEFRRLGSIAAGHPEYGLTPGVDATTGPLGQGFANAVGMAIAESHLAARFNKRNYSIIDHYTYVVCGDGDLQEGITWESISLAGHLGLSKLIVLFDSNDVQLDTLTSSTTSDNIKEKIEACNWNYIKVGVGTSIPLISNAIVKAKACSKPTLIEIKTVIGRGTTNEGTTKVHGSPLGEAETIKLRKKLSWKKPEFVISSSISSFFRRKIMDRCRPNYENHKALMENYKERFPEDYALLQEFLSSKRDLNISSDILNLNLSKELSTRSISGKILNELTKKYKNMIGGSADLSSSTFVKGPDGDFSRENRLGRNINFGIREHAMGAIANGIALHGGLIPFISTFFTFSDYLKPAIRLSALMKLPVMYIFTHDSIAVGEDGPTHQPIEQLTSLRCVPDLNVMRPCSTNEVIGAYDIALKSDVPTALILTRQPIPTLLNASMDIRKGAYIIKEEENPKQKLDFIMLSCGSEVDLCIKTATDFKEKNVRVVSMPSMYLFEKLSPSQKKAILPDNVPVIAVEMGSPMSWYKYAKYVYGIENFGYSGRIDEVKKEAGFTSRQLWEYAKGCT
ncbi:MAG: transketolase [Acholeplasmatales bacterium]|nr:transketolase [Acholeplasmatales bacterium]